MAADFETWVGVSESNGVVEEGSRGHEGGGGERAGAVEFDDGAIDPGGEAEIVGVDDEIAHWMSVVANEATSPTGDITEWELGLVQVPEL